MIWGIFLVWKYYAWTDHVFVQLEPENKVNSSESPRNSIWKRKDNNSYMWNSWGTNLTPKAMLTMTSYTFHLGDTQSEVNGSVCCAGTHKVMFYEAGKPNWSWEYTPLHSGKPHHCPTESCCKEQHFHLAGNGKIEPGASKNTSWSFPVISSFNLKPD